nr:hypothetical protein [Tissierella sp.]
MDYKEKDFKEPIDREIRKILKEDSDDLKLSFSSIEKIKKSRKISLREKISTLLNHEVEIPLTPAIIGFLLVIGISIFPKDFELPNKTEIIIINGSEIIIEKNKGVS